MKYSFLLSHALFSEDSPLRLFFSKFPDLSAAISTFILGVSEMISCFSQILLSPFRELCRLTPPDLCGYQTAVWTRYP